MMINFFNQQYRLKGGKLREITNLNQIVSEIKFFENQAIVSYWEIGKRLAQAKEQVPHGGWYDWINENLRYSEDTVENLMRIYREFPKTESIRDLTYTKLVALFPLEQEERKEFMEENNVSEMTVRELKSEVKEWKEESERQKQANETLIKQIEEKQEPQIIEKEVIKEVTKEPNDYQEIKRENEKLRNRLEKAKQSEKEALSKLNEQETKKKITTDAMAFAFDVDSFIKKVGGLVYLTDYIKDLPAHEKQMFENSIERLDEFAANIKHKYKERVGFNG